MLRSLLIIGLLMPLTACTAWFSNPDNDANGGNTSSQASTAQKTSASASSFDESVYFPLSDAEKQKVAAHIGNKINTYVTSSVLNGKYYVTDIEWHSGTTAIVDYEDGRVHGKARVTATIRNGEVEVLQFVEFFSE